MPVTTEDRQIEGPYGKIGVRVYTPGGKAGAVLVWSHGAHSSAATSTCRERLGRSAARRARHRSRRRGLPARAHSELGRRRGAGEARRTLPLSDCLRGSHRRVHVGDHLERSGPSLGHRRCQRRRLRDNGQQLPTLWCSSTPLSTPSCRRCPPSSRRRSRQTRPGRPRLDPGRSQRRNDPHRGGRRRRGRRPRRSGFRSHRPVRPGGGARRSPAGQQYAGAGRTVEATFPIGEPPAPAA